jgi:hypothetical protein
VARQRQREPGRSVRTTSANGRCGDGMTLTFDMRVGHVNPRGASGATTFYRDYELTGRRLYGGRPGARLS